MADLEHRSLHLQISGRVQGVGYRDWAVGQAEAAKLSGWVRNRSDGSVEIVVRGASAELDTFVAACRRGPRFARVTRLDAMPWTGAIPAAGFRRLPTE